jgi:hypothetical protein
MKKILIYLLLMFFAMPGLALADPATTSVLNPLNGNAWTLYVFGNGDAIFHILQSIKLLMLPESGETGFNSLLMFLATVGFLVLAIQAGFDPSKNLMKMFTYILVVASVHMMTLSITANIRIKDAVTNYDNVVPGVPALVGVPAALVSEVGHWFTKTVETYYNIPSEMTVSGGAFNLFGRLMQESNEYVISNPELKKSLSAYVADCVVPAMATGKLQASDLMTSPNMTTTLGKASHEAILTKYWPVGTPSTTGTGMGYSPTITYTGPGVGPVTYTVEGGLGAVVPCAAAWQELEKAMTTHAEELMNASARSWSKTGVLVPFETAMSSAMAMASSGGANAFGNYSRPQGYILQQAMLNSMNGSFRSAAASMGNNDVLMSAAIAQAEQSQKSSWFTAARVFTNMMGYVYTTLQAFIFAIVPVVIIALMVPGLGKSIFTNYSQILVWLMLWQPMLSIVNYLITLFGKAQISSSLELAAGVTMQNKFIMTEQTNDLMLAAQFLGTSVPLLTWGLVKGSLAFTEFISHGIGSSMAQQAGATAATGNMSMNNMSMDNASMNKFNTAMSSAVGAQTTMGYTGAAQSAFDSGGASMAQNGANLSRMVSTGLSKSQQTSLTSAGGYAEAASDNFSKAHQLSLNNSVGQNNAEIKQLTASGMENLSKSFSKTVGAGKSEGIDKTAGAGYDAANTILQQLEAQVRAGGEIKAETDKQVLGGIVSFLTGAKASASVGVSGSLSGSTNAALTERATALLNHKSGSDLKSGDSTGDGGSRTWAKGENNTNQVGKSRDRQWSESDQTAIQNALNISRTQASGAQQALTGMVSDSDTTSAAERPLEQNIAHLDTVGGALAGQVAAIQAEGARQIGTPGATSADGFTAMRDKARADIASSPANAAHDVIAATPLRGAPAAPAAVGGVDVTGGFDAGHAGSAATIAAAAAPLSATEKKLAANMVERKDVNALEYAFTNGDESIADAAKSVTDAKAKLGK